MWFSEVCRHEGLSKWKTFAYLYKLVLLLSKRVNPGIGKYKPVHS